MGFVCTTSKPLDQYLLADRKLTTSSHISIQEAKYSCSHLPNPIKTSWEAARNIVPTLWAAKKIDYEIYVGPKTSETFRIDAMIHLGMEDETEAPFSFEKKAYKCKFEDPDVDDKEPSGEDLTGSGTWDSCLEVMETDLDVEGIWKQVTSEIKVRLCSIS